MPASAVPTFLPALPEIFVGVSALVLLMVGVFRGERSATLVSWLSVAVFAIAALLVLKFGLVRQVALNGMFIT
ncbi:MAG TPA: NADH-quinone oxidoreductase subunit N, partial [Stellaceae bacterium]|nr:NADH-quinone oxidoreductase subunit N [Stellaceae bacterium]